MHDPRLDPELRDAAARLIAEQLGTSTDSPPSDTSAEQHLDELFQNRAHLSRSDVDIVGYDGSAITVTLLQRRSARRPSPRPAILYIHGGGMISGDRFFGVDEYLPWVESHDALLASVEYRLAPEFPDPVPVEDCYAAACWLFENAGDLEVDPGAVLIVGTSAGGGLAAGVNLLLRDRGGPTPLGQMLRSPMLDDRDESVSTRQQDRDAVWNRTSNRAGWTALLGERRGTADVSLYAAPARAEDLSDLPPTYLDTGSEDVFRDEITAFASAIWAADGEAELHVWPGGFHTFDIVAPTATMSQLSLTVRDAWLRRRLDSRRN